MDLVSLKDIWKQTLLVIKNKLEKSEVLTWFNMTALTSFDEETCRAKIGVTSLMFADNLKGKYLDIISQALEEVTGVDNVSVEVEILNDVHKHSKVIIDVSALLKKDDAKQG